jgi:CRISPR-associated protein Cmr2
MGQSLLVLNIGPVQDFIARARRTRDLWFGSHLLSELSRAAARSLAQEGWTLVFPWLETGDPELAPCDSRWRGDDHRPPLAIVNKVAAVGPGEAEAAARNARAAMVSRWEELAVTAHGRRWRSRRGEFTAGALLRPDCTLEKLESSIEDLLEVYAGWASVDELGYQAARTEIDREVAARKNLRDFTWWSGSELPKSSLDGFRETVLRKDRDWKAQSAAHRGRLGSTEQLDAIGFVKRFGGDPSQFASISRIAVHAWIDVVAARAASNAGVALLLTQARTACEQGEISRFDASALEGMEKFPFDGEVFFPDRWSSLKAELPEGNSFDTGPFQRLLREVGDPNPYVACLVADGDRMGEALSALDSAKDHQRISMRLAEFARAAPGIMGRHGGCAVYSGGDDVLAFLPVERAVAAAEELAGEFLRELRKAVPEGTPTLSVGIGIGHFHTPMGELLELGRSAEKLAKGAGLPKSQSRNALGIVLSKRGGAPVHWRAKWTASPRQRLEGLVTAILRDPHVAGGPPALPGGFPYEIRDQILARLPKEHDWSADFNMLLKREIGRAWDRKLAAMGRKGGSAPIPELDTILEEHLLSERLKAGSNALAPLDLGRATRHGVQDWIAMVAIAKHLSEHRQALLRVNRASRREAA